jgi:murein DD-endopeptidase MepM/ murein hydrolase activator NlpD
MSDNHLVSTSNARGHSEDLFCQYCDLNVGESAVYTTRTGVRKAIRLEAMDAGSIAVRVNSSLTRISAGPVTPETAPSSLGDLPSIAEIEGLRIGVDATRTFMTGTRYSVSSLNLHKDARLHVSEMQQPLASAITHVFPLPDFEWGFASNWLLKVIYGWHLGVDLYAGRGHLLVSIVDGTVIAMRHYRSGHDPEDYWGNNLGLLGEDGILYCYMHWDSVVEGIHLGSRVSAGDLIGSVGRTGFETKAIPSHLHLEMMILNHPERFCFAYEREPGVLVTPNRFLQPEVEGHVINPYPYLVEWYLGHA